MKRRTHLLPRYKVRSSPLHSSPFATSAQAVEAEALHVTPMEYVHRHIPSSSFRDVSVVLLTFIAFTVCRFVLSCVFSVVSGTTHSKCRSCPAPRPFVTPPMELLLAPRTYCAASSPKINHHASRAQQHRSTFDSFVKLLTQQHPKLHGRDAHTSYSASQSHTCGS